MRHDLVAQAVAEFGERVAECPEKVFRACFDPTFSRWHNSTSVIGL
jgi:hypothetical protein